jgi:tetratricopeptide (TPR) repeat protein
MQDAAAQGDWARAERTAREQIGALAADTLMLVDPHEALAQMAMLQGRLDEAERHWRTHRTLTQASGALGRQLFGALQRGYLALRYLGDTAQAVARVDSALAALPLHELLPGDRRYDEVARFYLAAGGIERGSEYLAAAEANDSARSLPPKSEREWTRGLHALARGEIPLAIERLERAAGTHPCAICVLPDLGRAYESAGRLEDAAAAYERYLTLPWLWRYEPDAAALGPTLLRLAGIADRLGDSTRARSARRRLLELWSRPDPTLAPTLQQVRSRLGELSAG